MILLILISNGKNVNVLSRLFLVTASKTNG